MYKKKILQKIELERIVSRVVTKNPQKLTLD